MKLFSVVILALCLASCKTEDLSNKAIFNVKEIPDSTIVLNKWQVLGPLPVRDEKNSLNINNLECFGLKEDTVSFDGFLKISKSGLKDTLVMDTTFTNKYLFSGATPIEFKDLPGIAAIEGKGDYYFACQINCKRPISTRLHFSCNAKAKIWLNNQLFYCADYALPIASYREFRPIKLNAGKNFLLIKIHQPKKGTELYARLENTNQRAMERAYGLSNQAILEWSVYTWGDTVKLNDRFPPSSGEIKILNCNKELIVNDSIQNGKRWVHSIAGFEKGLYQVQVKAGDITITQDFYRGNIVDSIQGIVNMIQQIKTSGSIKRNIDALVFRFHHLQKNTWSGDPKYVSLFIQLKDSYSNLKREANPFKHTKGCFIRSYISEIDSSQQFYILHIPKNYIPQKSSPVVFVVPAIINPAPYLESFRAANSKLIDYFQFLAEKYGLIMVQPGSRRYKVPNFNTIEDAELFNILNDIGADYTIDRNRLYLTGTCSGGNEALKLATKFPGTFAALGLVSPEVVFPNESRESAVYFLKNLSNTPVYIIHSSIDRHVPVERSRLLYDCANKMGLEGFDYEEIPREFPKYYSDDFFDEAIGFCTKFTLEPRPEEINFSTSQMLYNSSYWVTLNHIQDTARFHAKMKWPNTLKIDKENVLNYSIDLKKLPFNPDKTLKVVDNDSVVFEGHPSGDWLTIGVKPTGVMKTNTVAGPFSHLFSQRFIVVYGTSGLPGESHKLDSVAQKISDLWYNRYFVRCIVKKDVEVTGNDIDQANLLLLGNFQSNTLLRSLKETIPLQISDSSVCINNKTITGNQLCYYMIYPNPQNSSKYVAIIGYNNPRYVAIGNEDEGGLLLDISNYGWYDYKIWNCKNADQTDVQYSGYFSSKWGRE